MLPFVVLPANTGVGFVWQFPLASHLPVYLPGAMAGAKQTRLRVHDQIDGYSFHQRAMPALGDRKRPLGDSGIRPRNSLPRAPRTPRAVRPDWTDRADRVSRGSKTSAKDAGDACFSFYFRGKSFRVPAEALSPQMRRVPPCTICESDRTPENDRRVGSRHGI